MIRLATQLAIADNRRSPARTAATAVLLTSAVWFPVALRAPRVLGLVIAVATAMASTAGSVALAERRARVLDHNGADRGLRRWAAALSMLVPGVVACVVSVASLVATGRGGLIVPILTTIVVPMATAPMAERLARSDRLAGTERSVNRSGRLANRISIIVLVAISLVLWPLGIALIGYKCTAGSWSAKRSRRILGVVLSVVVIVGTVVAAGASDSWTDLAFVLTVALPGFVVAITTLGGSIISTVSAAAAHRGSHARIALAPFGARRRVLAPLTGLVVVILTLAVTDGVVGASFGAREAARLDTPTTTSRAGNLDEQVIVPAQPVDADALRDLVDRKLQGTGTTGVVIEMVGTGDASALRFARHADEPSGLARSMYSSTMQETSVSLASTSPTSTSPAQTGSDSTDNEIRPNDGTEASPSTWIGIVRPQDLSALGWADARGPLDEGKVVLTSGRLPGIDHQVQVVAGGRRLSLPAVAVAANRGGALLPGAIVTRRTALRLSPIRPAARVVVVPTPDAGSTPPSAGLTTLAHDVANAMAVADLAEPANVSSVQSDDLEVYGFLLAPAIGKRQVFSGSDQIMSEASGPLNDLPYFAGTADQGRRGMLGLIGLPVVITLAVVFLALGATRRDDIVLEVQGATDRLQTQVAALQSAAITVSASVVAAVIGIGAPALVFALYNRGATLPDIPLVIPGTVWLVLIGVPIATIAMAALLSVLHRRGTGPDLGSTPEAIW